MSTTFDKQRNSAPQPGSIGQLLMRARKKLRLSQAELAGQIGVTRQSVIAMEKGSTGLSIGTILKAIGVLGLTIEITPHDRSGADPAPPATLEHASESQSAVDQTPNGTTASASLAAALPDIDRIIDDACSGNRFPIFREPLPNRARKRKTEEAA